MKKVDIIDKFIAKDKYINGWKKKRIAAITIPLVEKNDELNILFQVRAKTLRHQPLDVCFPGGKIEEGETPKEAALRETVEELGLSYNDITLVNELDTLVRYDGTIVHIFLVFINDEAININKDEVDHVFYAPLKELLNQTPKIYSNRITVVRHDEFPYHRINGGENYRFRDGAQESIFYEYKNYNIWGMTGEILKGFLDEMKETNGI